LKIIKELYYDARPNKSHIPANSRQAVTDSYLFRLNSDKSESCYKNNLGTERQCKRTDPNHSVPILSQFNPVHASPPLSEIHFNNVFALCLGLPSCLFPSAPTSHPPPKSCMHLSSRVPHVPYFRHPNALYVSVSSDDSLPTHAEVSQVVVHDFRLLHAFVIVLFVPASLTIIRSVILVNVKQSN
jgi:hypothetical protein